MTVGGGEMEWCRLCCSNGGTETGGPIDFVRVSSREPARCGGVELRELGSRALGRKGKNGETYRGESTSAPASMSNRTMGSLPDEDAA